MTTSRKLHRGQVLDALPASEWNRFVDTADRVAQAGERGLLGRNRREVRIENGTGADIPTDYPILAMDGVRIDPGNNLSEWRDKLVFKGVTPGRRLVSILERVDASAPPPTETAGDRYLLDDATPHTAWDGAEKDSLVEYDGNDWNATALAKDDLVLDRSSIPDEWLDWKYDGKEWTSQPAGSLESSFDSLAILPRSVRLGEIDTAAVSGLARVRLSVRHELHTHARAESSTRLRSSFIGPARIVWREALDEGEQETVDGGGSVDKWAIVQIEPFESPIEGYLIDPIDGQNQPRARVAVYAGDSPTSWKRVGQTTVRTRAVEAIGQKGQYVLIHRIGSELRPTVDCGLGNLDGLDLEPGTDE